MVRFILLLLFFPKCRHVARIPTSVFYSVFSFRLRFFQLRRLKAGGLLICYSFLPGFSEPLSGSWSFSILPPMFSKSSRLRVVDEWGSAPWDFDAEGSEAQERPSTVE